MTNPTSNFGWQMPTSTDLVTDLPADFEVFGQAVDTSLADLRGGTTNQVLAKNSNTDMDFKWVADAAGMTNPMTTTGDVIYSSPASTPVRLGIGTANQVLSVNSGATAPEWKTLSSGGYTLLSTTTLTGNSVTISSIPTTYKHLFFTITNLTCSANDDFAIRFNGSTASNYNVINFGRTTAGTFGTGGGFALNRISYDDFCSNNAQIGTGEMFIANYTSTNASSKSITGCFMGKNTAGSAFQRFASGYYAETSAITSITVLGFGGATFTTGTITLYGVA